MSLLPPVDIFEVKRKGTGRIDTYLENAKQNMLNRVGDLDTARRIKTNLDYLKSKHDYQIRSRLRMDYNSGIDDEVWGKLSVCDKVLDNYDPLRVAEVRRLFKDLRSEIINRKMDEFTYGYLEETSVEDIVNDHLPPVDFVFKKGNDYYFGMLVTRALLTAEKAYRGFKK